MTKSYRKGEQVRIKGAVYTIADMDYDGQSGKIIRPFSVDEVEEPTAKIRDTVLLKNLGREAYVSYVYPNFAIEVYVNINGETGRFVVQEGAYEVLKQ